MRPDAIPVRPVASRVMLPPDAASTLFGSSTLRGTERVEVVRLGRVVAAVEAVAGRALALALDATTALDATSGLRLRGPVGVLDAEPVERVQTQLTLPDALRRAWALPDEATVALGTVAVAVPVGAAPETAVHVDRALWLAAGRPETARWLPAVRLEAPDPEPANSPRVVRQRVVTETDVRQARLRHERIRLVSGQIVTPAARSLGRDWGVFMEG